MQGEAFEGDGNRFWRDFADQRQVLLCGSNFQCVWWTFSCIDIPSVMKLEPLYTENSHELMAWLHLREWYAIMCSQPTGDGNLDLVDVGMS